MNLRRRAVVVSLSVFALLCAAAVRWQGGKEGEDLLIQRKYQQAAAALAAALPGTAPGEQDRVLFLLGQANLLAGDNQAAVAAFRRLCAEQAGSALVASARFQEAKALEKSGDLRAAAQIYRERIEQAIGLQRKEEVAATYLGLAEKAQSKEPPEYQRVVTFCDLALDLGLQPQRAAAVRLKAAEALLAAGDHQGAILRLQPLVVELDVASGRLRAMLALGRARRLQGDLAGARAVLRDLRAAAPAAPEAGDASYEIALSYGVPEPDPQRLDRAVSALRDLQQQHPTHQKARLAQFLAAQCYQHVGRAEEALAALRQFLAEQGDSGLDEVATARAMVGDVLAGQGKSADAIAAWRDYLQQHPAHGAWERVQRAIVDTEYGLAFAAYQAGKEQFEVARTRLLAFARQNPLDPRNPDVLWLFGDMLQQEQHYDEARAAFARCVSKYPGKDQSSRAQLAIGEIFETKTFNYEQALAAYRAVTWGSSQPEAQRRIARLVQKQLQLRTDRVFRTDEAPVFAVTSRNIEKLRVRVFRLDLEDYFRATHTAGDVHRLDIEVIAPDQTFDSAVPDYVRYRATTREVALPFREPGAYVVKVDDRELEATTMVLVSDLALIAKSSRHEFFVFTQNTRGNEPAGGVKVVLGDGSKQVAEGVTGQDGVWRFRGDELKNCERLAVFAVDAHGSGASSLDLSGMGYSPGLTAKGHLSTDRPLYQPGQRVHLKGIVREVADGRYRLPQGTGWRLQVLSPGGRLLVARDVQFTAFGTFASEVDLPAEAELGDWRIAVTREGSAELVFGSTFAVARYERPRLSLRIELEQPLVFRGEEIKGRIAASWFYGEPAAGKQVAYKLALPDGGATLRTGTTDARGELAFALPTTEFAEEALALLSAQLPADGVSTQVAVPVVTTEFTPALTTVRSVYLAKEPFEVTVTLKDQSGKALQRQADAVLLRLEQAPGRQDLVETEVARRQITTDQLGVVRATFAADKGGQYRVRVLAKDRFGNQTSGELPLTVSGDDDEVKLRLLCDQETFKVGESAALKVVNRAGPRLALLTWQGDGILAYETRVLPAGESTLQLGLLPEHAPNFALALAMVDGKRLHTAEREFRVLRDLQITVQAPAVSKPGEKIDVAVTAKDPQGRPVQAEIALAMVDDALLALRGDSTPRLGAFFYGQLRETAFRTSSSCTWSYAAASRRVNEELLAEETRRAHHEQQPPPGGGGGDEAPGNEEPAAAGERLERAGGLLDNLRAAGRRGAADGFATAGPAGPVTGAPQGAAKMQTQSATELSIGRFAFDQYDRPSYYLGVGGVIPGVQATDLTGFGQGTGDLAAAFALNSVASDQPRVDFRETGAWISSLLTDAQGRATATIELPHSTTSWHLHARAVTADTWVGEGEGRLRTQQELQVDFVGPPMLTEGDTTEFGVRVHNLTDRALPGHAELTVTAGTAAETRQQELELAAHGDAVAAFAQQVASAESLQLQLTGRGGALADRMEFTVPVLPFGAEFVDGRSGSTRDRAAFELGLEAGREYTALRMIVELGPDPGRDLVMAALGGGWLPRSCMQVAETNLSRSSRGLAALVVLDYLERAGVGSKTDTSRLLGRALAMLQSLLATQLQDGSVAWVGGKSQDPRSTCQFVRFLAACRRRGLETAEAPLGRAAEWLQQALRTAGNDVRPDVLWALAAAGRARFESLNSLHRARTGLPADALARLSLAWQEQKRPELAAEVLDALRAAMPQAALGKLPLETVALAAQALLLADKRDALGIAAADFVRAARRGAGWGTPEATAAALQLLARVRGGEAGAPAATEVAVTINGKALATTPREAMGLETVFTVPPAWLQERGNKVTIAVAGGGEAFWSVNLIGFARGFRDADRNDQLVHVERHYLAAPRRHADHDVPAGFSVITGHDYQGWRNEVTQLHVGETARVEVGFYTRHDEDRAHLVPMVLEEPIPAGCSVSRSSIQGTFEQVDVQPDRLVFFCREGNANGSVSYELQARFPGQYRALPSRVYAALRPELGAYGTVGTLTVHARGAGADDAYRLTPDELFWLGKAWFDAAQSLAGDARKAAVATSAEHLERLLADWQKKDFRLRDETFKEVARMLLFLGIERQDGKSVVRFFEELKDRYADLVIPFDKILAVGQSYLDLGEFEAALLVFRATAEASFLKDAAVATTLEGLGEVKAGTEFLERLLLAYPDLNTMRVARYSIAQKLAAMAAAMDPAAPVDERVGAAAVLRRHALAGFREFLVLYPEDPLAEEVSFAWATTQLEGKDLQGALAVATAALARYPQSPLTDELLYTQGYAQFALGDHAAAFATLQRVATEQFPNDKGGRGESESKWHAIYLQGQIHHARGEPKEALLAYQQVQDRFTDAGEAADYFLRKQLALPEVATFPLAQPATLELTFRNVAKASLQVFKVDLMRLYLLEKSLNDIRGIQLHGIKPLLGQELQLGDGRDYKNRVLKVPLDLKEPGAYLAVVRGDDRTATGMVLKSDLKIEAQEQTDVGRIRVNVAQGETFLADAHVKIVGSGDGNFRSGDTDLRGVFAGDGLVGMATVIAQKGDQYAFYRGTAVHQPAAYRPPAPTLVEPPAEKRFKDARDFDALEQNLNRNTQNRGRQVEWLKNEVLNKQQKGVEVYRTK